MKRLVKLFLGLVMFMSVTAFAQVDFNYYRNQLLTCNPSNAVCAASVVLNAMEATYNGNTPNPGYYTLVCKCDASAYFLCELVRGYERQAINGKIYLGSVALCDADVQIAARTAQFCDASAYLWFVDVNTRQMVRKYYVGDINACLSDANTKKK